jgi:hypothetical protein
MVLLRREGRHERDEVLAKFKRDPDLRTIPVVVLSRRP